MAEPMTDAELAAIEDDARTNDIPDYEAQVYVRELLAEVRRLREAAEHHVRIKNGYIDTIRGQDKAHAETMGVLGELRARLALYEPQERDETMVCPGCGQGDSFSTISPGDRLQWCRCCYGPRLPIPKWRYDLAERIKRGEVG